MDGSDYWQICRWDYDDGNDDGDGDGYDGEISWESLTFSMLE